MIFVSNFKKENMAKITFEKVPNGSVKKFLAEKGIPAIDRNIFIANYWQLQDVFEYFESEEILYDEDFVDSYRRYLKFLDFKRESLDKRINRVNKKVAEVIPNGKLFEHQEYGIRFSAARNSVIIADCMGLGKTLTAIASIPAKVPVLVISPANAKHVWRKQFKQWLDRDVEVLDGRKSFRFPNGSEVIVINYDILPEGLYRKVPRNEDGTEKTKKEKDAFNRELRKNREAILKDCPDGLVVILDEAHKLKNKKTLRGKRFSYISDAVKKKDGKIWALTGTPLNNNADELYSVLYAIDAVEESFGSYDNFRKEFGGILTNYGMKWGRPRPTAKYYLSNVMLRRTVEDVFDLPKVTEIDFPMEVDETAIAACNEFEELLDKLGISLEEALELAFNPRSEIAMHVFQLKEQLAIAKIPAVLEKVEEAEEAGIKMIVASCHLKPLDFFGERKGWAKITGAVSSKNRSKIEDGFQNGLYSGLALSVLAGGEALTLTEASHMIIVDRYWTPGAEKQVKGRINRPGQTKPMFIYNATIANHPLEMKIAEILSKKEALIDATVEEVTRLDVSGRSGMIL